MVEKYEGKHCEECGTGKEITKDHIIPRWLERRLPFFNLNIFMINNEQYLCKPDNQQKGGRIDYRDSRVRRFLRKFIEAIEEKLQETETEIRVEKMKATIEAKKKIGIYKKATPKEDDVVKKIEF